MSARPSGSARPPRRRHRPLRRLATLCLAAIAVLLLAPTPASGVDDAAGQVLVRGAAANFGVAPGRPIIGMARTLSGNGYWLAGADGAVFAFGDAAFHGGANELGLRAPVVDIAASPAGQGYVLAGRDGGVFAFGDVAYAGSAGHVRMNAPMVGIATTPTGKGYWLSSRDGGVFAFGDAVFLGSAAGAALNAPIVAIDATTSGNGYRLLARDGGVFAFGDAAFAGSPAGHAGGPFVDITGTGDGKGYWVAGAEGNVLAFGSASPAASMATGKANFAAPVTAVQATPAGDGVWLATGGEPLGEFSVTCYALSGITASGAAVSEAVVAVDPRAIAMGSEIFVAGVGIRRALDTGGSIKGRRLDIWNPSAGYCRGFGLQRRTAYAA